MPFLDEQELASLQKEIHDANVKRDELETDLSAKGEELAKAKSSGRMLNLLFAILAGAGLATAFFMYKNVGTLKANNNSTTQEVVATTDSSDQNSSTDESIADIKTVDEAIDDVRNSTSGETVYSVQVGVFSKKKFPLLSETIAGTTSQGNVFKYSVGLFKTLEEAQAFRKELVKVGFKDAFVASYIDSQRQKIHTPD